MIEHKYDDHLGIFLKKLYDDQFGIEGVLSKGTIYSKKIDSWEIYL